MVTLFWGRIRDVDEAGQKDETRKDRGRLRRMQMIREALYMI